MRVFRDFRKMIALPLVALMMALSMPMGVAHAALVGTDQVIDTKSAAEARAQVVAFLTREDVQAQAQALGVDARDAELRVAAMSDSEVQQVAARIDQMPAGQGAVGAIVGAAVLIFIILLITDLAGVTDIFPFIKKNKR